jgi:branched-chain amino acid transport system ATP-binding protein
MSKKLLELKNVTIKFGGVTALDQLNFQVNEGEICALIGPNGAGKTTVFNVVTGVYPVTSGDIIFNGENLKGKQRHQVVKSGLARTFQNVRLFGDMTALENVITATDVHKKTGLVRALIGTPLNRREERESKERALELLEFMGIDHRADQLA